MSDSGRSEQQAFRELELLVRNLAEELAGFRRRALTAEARLRELQEDPAARSGPPPAERIAELEVENAALRERLDGASSRTRMMLDRVHFLRQQVQGGDR